MAENEPVRETITPTRVSSSATRVDTAHVRAHETVMLELSDGAPNDSATADSIGVQTPVSERVAAWSQAAGSEQVRYQASQLAAHLQRQQTAIDHREAELNSRLAALENQVRSARLWLNERHAELAQHKGDLDRRERELSAREAEAAKAPAKRTRNQAAKPESELAQLQAELHRREVELNALAARLAENQLQQEQRRDVSRSLATMDKRHEGLDRAEKLLAADRAELDLQRQSLAAERREFAETIQAERHKLAQDQQTAQQEQAAVRHQLARRSDELDSRQAALEQMRADVAQAQQQGLEIRLATEELWSRLCGTMAPAALTQSLAQIRLRISDEQKLARKELAEQKAEMQGLSRRIAEQHEKLARDREELRAWFADRQKQLEQEAAVLGAGQERLNEERAAVAGQKVAWQNERYQLQQEIRRLLRQLPRAAA